MFTEQMTQELSIPVASLAPANLASNNTTATVVGPIDMSKFKRAMGHVVAGVITDSTNCLVQWQASANSGNSFSNIASGPTVLIANNTWDVTIEIRADQLPAGTRYLRLALLVSGGANTGIFVSASVFGGSAPYKPANAQDVASSNTFTLSRAVASL